MERMAVRPKIQIDCSQELINKIQALARAKKSRSFREFVLLSIAKAHPEVLVEIYQELGLSNVLDQFGLGDKELD